MTTSGTTTAEATRDKIVALALTNVGGIGPGETPFAEKVVHASNLLEMLSKSIDADGHFLWRTVRRTLTLTAGNASYPLDADVRALQPEARYLRPGSTAGILMWPMGSKQFMQLPDRTNQGPPVQFWGEKALGRVTMQLWPTPSEAGTIEYSATLRAQDFRHGTDTPDYPPEWELCLVYGLTADLAPGYGDLKMAAFYSGKYLAMKETLNSSDTEQQGLVFRPGLY